MIGYTLKRLLLLIPLLLGITLMSFALTKALPGDPVQGMVGERATPETIERILGHLGLPTEPPQPAPARAPPQCAFDFVDFDEPELDDVDVIYVD